MSLFLLLSIMSIFPLLLTLRLPLSLPPRLLLSLSFVCVVCRGTVAAMVMGFTSRRFCIRWSPRVWILGMEGCKNCRYAHARRFGDGIRRNCSRKQIAAAARGQHLHQHGQDRVAISRTKRRNAPRSPLQAQRRNVSKTNKRFAWPLGRLTVHCSSVHWLTTTLHLLCLFHSFPSFLPLFSLFPPFPVLHLLRLFACSRMVTATNRSCVCAACR